MLPIKVRRDFRIIAHRGASGYAPENTFAAFELAVSMGVREVELDTQLTWDGVIVICHDRTLEKYGHGDRVVEDLSWDELSKLDMGSWFSPFRYSGEKMVTLGDLFQRYKDTLCYHVEIKGEAADLPQTLVAETERHGLGGYCIFTSFNYAKLAEIRKIRPKAKLGWLVDRLDREVLERAARLGTYQVCPAASSVDRVGVDGAREFVDEVRALGIRGRTNLETINLIRRVIQSGCDGMTIDWPDWVSY